MRDLEEKELANIEQCGRVGFSYEELAAVLAVPVEEVEEQFRDKCGKVYEAWLKGRMQVEIELRQAMLRDALNGSSPMLEKMLSIYRKTEETNRKLIY